MRTPAAYVRATRKLVAVMVAVSLLTPLAAARGAAACGSKSGSWTTFAGPRFPAGSQAITDLAIDARTPSRLFVTNGTSVMRSTDGGCSWDHSYTLGDQSSDALAYTAANSRIVSLVAPEAGGRVLISIAETVANQTRPHVLVSFDAGRSWASGDQGLPPLGSPEGLVVASSSPDVAYLAIDLSGGTLDTLYASSDGGRTWELRSQPRVGGEFAGFEVDPIVPNELWAYGNGLHQSTDGGATWTPVPEFVGTATGPVDVFHSGGQPSSIFVFIPSEAIVQQSTDGGRTWLQSSGLSAPDSADHGATAASRVATSAGNAYIWAPSLLQWVDANAPQNGVKDVSATRTPETEFYMHNGSSILVFSGGTGGGVEFDVDEFDMGEISIGNPDTALDLDPPKLQPARDVIKIPAGETKRVRYDLSLSKIRTPLDLYFLIDTSESAKPFLLGLGRTLATIVEELYEARLDVRFGLSEYRAYPDSTPPRPECSDEDLPLPEDHRCERNFIYRQVVDIPNSTPQTLATAIEGLVPIAGGHYNSQLGALQQVADGSGVDDWPYGGTSESHLDGHDVPPGQDASFRKKALKIVLISTDEEFSTGQPYQDDDFPPDIPSFEEVSASLNARDIHQVGLALTAAPLPDMQRIASSTGAVAPSEGADCDGNGAPDIGPGGPLVCTVNQSSLEEGSNLVPAIVNMVEAVRDTEAVTLEVDSKEPVVDKVTPDEYPGVVLQADHDLEFEVTYRCPMTLAGERTEVDLSATQGGSILSDATATVVCGRVADKKDRKDFFDIFPFDRVLGILPLLPLSPPPTLTNPSQATQAQSQAQAQGAMATQEQEQPQVALATQYKSALREALGKEEEYAMTSYRERTRGEVPPGLFLGAASLIMSAAYAVAVSRRRRVRVARARRRP